MNSPIGTVYYAILKKNVPDLKREDVKDLSTGNDHFVFVVKDQLVFRFPKIQRKIDPKQSEFLKQLTLLSPLPLPVSEIHTDEDTGIWYEIHPYIPGVSFYPKIAKSFSSNELSVIAQKLGAFLSVIHAFPVEEARKLQLDELNPQDFWVYMEQNRNAYPAFKKRVFPHVTHEEQVWIENLFTDYIALIREKPFQTKVTHADMWTYHIIVHPEYHTLSGVIDFWGRIADPANDFKAFEYYGKDFVQEVYRNYSLPVDEDFEKRRLFYTGHDEVFELARQVQKGDEEHIIKQRKSLSDYISTHPLDQ